MNQSYPDSTSTVDEARFHDSLWDSERHVRVRLVAEHRDHVIGIGRINHIPDEFHPQKYWLEIAVDPAARGQGVGAMLYRHLLAELHARGAIAARAGAHQDTMVDSIRFLERRGFIEAQRGWQSRLHVRGFDAARFADAEDRVARQGIVLTTLAAELERDPEALTRAHEMVSACERDIPSLDPVTPAPLEVFVAHSVESPNAAPDAFFIAKDDDRYVGVSAMYRPLAEPGIIYQGITGVLHAYRGRGIAMALKLQTVRYARAAGYVEIRTWNDVRNRPMLRINVAMGFVRQPASIIYEKRLAGGEGGSLGT